MAKLISSLLVIICITLIIFAFIYNNHQEQTEIIARARQIDAYFNKTEEAKDDDKHNYIAILEIPDASLLEGLVAIDSKYNDVKYNIQILKESAMPNKPMGNLILAAHNGNSNVSYFKKLETNLKEKSKVIVHYNNYKYMYEISNAFTVEKNGQVNITRDISRNTITLITCKNNSDTKQIVFIGYLIEVKEEE